MMPSECAPTSIFVESWSLDRINSELQELRGRCSKDEELVFHYGSVQAVKEILADLRQLEEKHLVPKSPLDVLGQASPPASSIEQVQRNLDETDSPELPGLWRENWKRFRESMVSQLENGNGREADAMIIVKQNADETSVLAVWQLAPRKMTTVVIGNPRVGKSALLNHLVGSDTFKSGVTRGGGITEHLQEFFNEADGEYYADTPGFNDVDRKDATAQEISKALKEDGTFRLVFMIQMPGGGFQEQDLAIIRLVCDALKDFTRIPCGIIVNKVFHHEWAEIKKNLEAGAYSAKLNRFCPLPQEDWTPDHFLMVPAQQGSQTFDEVFDGVGDWVKKLKAIEINAGQVGEISAMGSLPRIRFEARVQELQKKTEQYIRGLWMIVLGCLCCFLILATFGWFVFFQPILQQELRELSELKLLIDNGTGTFVKLNQKRWALQAQLNTTAMKLAQTEATLQNLPRNFTFKKPRETDLAKEQLRSLELQKEKEEEQRQKLAQRLASASAEQKHIEDEMAQTRRETAALKDWPIFGRFLPFVCSLVIGVCLLVGLRAADAREALPLHQSLLQNEHP
eukprot:Skav208912  [mRNA]  locus=scaffold270:639495:642402:- [translate_table: standard]